MNKKNINFRNIVDHYTKKFNDNFHLLPIIGCELEFYTKEPTSIEDISNSLDNKNIKITEEEGENQHELQFSHTHDLHSLLEDIKNAKHKLKKIADFDSYPYEDQPTSSMHLHLNFLDEDAKNVFDKKNGKNPLILAHCVAGLLNSMKESCIFFAPSHNDYNRYIIKTMNTPSNISWGINNRTTALRITPRESGFRRIEHRLASSNADPEKVLAVILAGSYEGIRNKALPEEPTYGNAFDSQYILEKLPHSLKEAQTMFMQSRFASILTDLEEA